MVGYLLQPIIQIENSDGKPLEGGKVYVYKLGITPPVLADTYFDFQGHLNTNPIILDSLGHCTIIAEDDTAYDVIIKNKDDELQFSIHNATVMGGSGEIVIENPEVNVVAGEGIAVSSSRGLDGVITYTVALGASVISHLNDIDVNIVNLQNEDIDIHNDIDVANTNIQNNSNAITQISTNLANTMLTVISNTSRIEALENGGDSTTYELPLKKEGNVVSNNGYNLTVSGNYAWAEGVSTESSGSCSHAEGSNTKASGEYTHAEGLSTEANGDRSHAGGFSTKATGTESFAHGNSAISNGRASSALGFGVVTNEQGALAIGKYNVDEAGHVFQVGIGSLPSERKDAFQIDTDGTIRYIYNDEMVQLKPLVSSGYGNKFESTYTITANDIQRRHFGVEFENIEDFKDWIKTGIISSPVFFDIRIIKSTFSAQWEGVNLSVRRMFQHTPTNTLFTDYQIMGKSSGHLLFGNDEFTGVQGNWNPYISVDWNPGYSPFVQDETIRIELGIQSVKLE